MNARSDSTRRLTGTERRGPVVATVVPRAPTAPAALRVLQRLAGNRAVTAHVGARLVIQRSPGDARTGRVVVDPFIGRLLVRVAGVAQRFELLDGHGFAEGDHVNFTEGAPNAAGGRPTVVDPVRADGPPPVAAAPVVAPPVAWHLGAPGARAAVDLTVADVLAGAVVPIAVGHHHHLGDVTLEAGAGGTPVRVNVHRNAGANVQGGGYSIDGHWSLGNAPDTLAQAIAGHPGYAAAVAAAERRL